MPRIARAVATGFPHHITQRGNYRQDIFGHEGDYSAYLKLLLEYFSRHALQIWAYCLMTNHVHLVAVPGDEESLGNTFRTLNMRYAQHFNRRLGARGHLWQGRYYSTALDERHLYAAVRYVENNPVRAGMVERAEDYRWSSARAHVAGSADSLLSDTCPLTEGIKDWRAYLLETEDAAVLDTIRRNTVTGRPSGSEGFVDALEQIMRRRLVALPHGRPKKKQ